MATLSKKHKVFIVKQLACFEKPTKVTELVKEEFDIEVSRQQVNYYNPENAQGNRQLSEDWKQLFSKEREEFLADTSHIAIAHKPVRLKYLQRIVDKYWEMGNYKAVMEALEQAAKEMSDAYGPMNEMLADKLGDGQVNFYQQINQKIVQLNQK